MIQWRVIGVLAVAVFLVGCGPAEDESGAPDASTGEDARSAEAADEAERVVAKSSAAERSGRRLFDGAPPIVPHADIRGDCVACHDEIGVEVAGVGYAPPTPHALTPGIGLASRCVQCHVYQASASVFRGNRFEGLRQDLRPGDRLTGLSPPVMPHPRFLRENCLACHDGPAVREAIRTDHPERSRCEQCHLEQQATDVWRGPA